MPHSMKDYWVNPNSILIEEQANEDGMIRIATQDTEWGTAGKRG